MYMKTRDETKVLNHLSRLYGTTTKNVQHYVEDYKAQTNMQNNTMSVWQVRSFCLVTYFSGTNYYGHIFLRSVFSYFESKSFLGQQKLMRHRGSTLIGGLTKFYSENLDQWPGKLL